MGNYKKYFLNIFNIFKKYFHQGLINGNTKNKIEFIDNDSMNVFFNYFDKNEIEKKNGGNLPNIRKYWPPQNNLSKNHLTFKEFLKYYLFILRKKHN